MQIKHYSTFNIFGRNITNSQRYYKYNKHKLASRIFGLFIGLSLCSINLANAAALAETGWCQHYRGDYLKQTPENLFAWDLYDNGKQTFYMLKNSSDEGLHNQESTPLSVTLETNNEYDVQFSDDEMHLIAAYSIGCGIRKPRKKMDSGICSINSNWTFRYKSSIDKTHELWEATTTEKIRGFNKTISIALRCTIDTKPRTSVVTHMGVAYSKKPSDNDACSVDDFAISWAQALGLKDDEVWPPSAPKSSTHEQKN